VARERAENLGATVPRPRAQEGASPVKVRRLEAVGFGTQLAKVASAITPPSRQRQRNPAPILIVHEFGVPLIPVGESQAGVSEHLKLTCSEHLGTRIDAHRSLE
jgi:hypothetical protein